MLTAANQQNFEKTYQLYDTLHRYCAVAFTVFLVLSVVLFFVFLVLQILIKMTGRFLY